MAAPVSTSTSADRLIRYMLPVLHIAVLALSVLLIAYITYDTLLNISFVTNPRYLKVQLWICLFFLAEILIECVLSETCHPK